MYLVHVNTIYNAYKFASFLTMCLLTRTRAIEGRLFLFVTNRPVASGRHQGGQKKYKGGGVTFGSKY